MWKKKKVLYKPVSVGYTSPGFHVLLHLRFEKARIYERETHDTQTQTNEQYVENHTQRLTEVKSSFIRGKKAGKSFTHSSFNLISSDY